MDVRTAGGMVIGAVVAVLGACVVVFRVPLSSAARDARRRTGGRNADSQTPALYLVCGLFFALAGVLLVIGLATGWLHPR